MAVKIRLTRMGSKKKPFYRINVADSRSPRDGRFIETVGTYNPLVAENQVTLKEDRVLAWLADGAQPSDTVRNILSKEGVLKKFHDSKFSKYFEYTYGIDAPKNLKTLVEKGYADIETAFDSLDHLNSTMKKNILKIKGITGLFKMKATDLDQALHDNLTEEELASHFSIRGYKLTPKGEQILKQYQDIVDRHPKKNL